MIDQKLLEEFVIDGHDLIVLCIFHRKFDFETIQDISHPLIIKLVDGSSSRICFQPGENQTTLKSHCALYQIELESFTGAEKKHIKSLQIHIKQ